MGAIVADHLREENGVFLSARSKVFRGLYRNRAVQLSVGAVASGGLAYLAVRSLAWRDVADTLADFPLWSVPIALVPLAVAVLLRAARWYVLLPGAGVSLKQVVLVQNAGIGLNNMLPVRMVSEPVQLALITRRYRVPFPTALATLVAGNVLDIFATAMLMGLGILLVPGLREGRVSIQLAGALILFVISLLVFIVVARGLDAIPIAKRVHFFQQLTVAIGLLRDMPGRLWLSFFGTAGHWFFVGVAGWVISSALGIDVGPLTMATILVAAMFFTSVVPSLPGGAGTYHFAVVSMMTAVGADAAVALIFAIVVHLMIFLPPSIVALVVLWKVGVGVMLRGGEAPLGSKLGPVPSGAAPDRPAR